MDGIRAALKSCVYRDVMSGKSVIDTPKSFPEHADKAVKGVTSLYLPTEDVLIEPDHIVPERSLLAVFQNGYQ